MLTENGLNENVTATALEGDGAVALFDRPGTAARGGKPKTVPWSLVSGLRGGRFSFRRDDAGGLSLDLAGDGVRVSIWSVGPNDRTVGQRLAAHSGWTLDGVTAHHAGAGYECAERVTVSAALLSECLGYLSDAASTDSTRPALGAIHIDGGRWAASDGHRAHYLAAPVALSSAPLSIPLPAVAAALRAIAATKAATVDVYRTTGGVAFWAAGPSLAVTVSSVTGEVFPAVFPVDKSTRGELHGRRVVTVSNGWRLGEWLASSAPVWLAPGGRSKTVRLTIDEGGAVALVAPDGVAVPVPGVTADSGEEPAAVVCCRDYLREAVERSPGAVRLAVSVERQKGERWTLDAIEVDAPAGVHGLDASALVMPVRA